MLVVFFRINSVLFRHGNHLLSIITHLLMPPPHPLVGIPGLDSFMAEAVVTKLKALADTGRTIVATIHQPSSHVRERESPIEGCTYSFGSLGPEACVLLPGIYSNLLES